MEKLNETTGERGEADEGRETWAFKSMTVHPSKQDKYHAGTMTSTRSEIQKHQKGDLCDESERG